jgi:hypothetical protein
MKLVTTPEQVARKHANEDMTNREVVIIKNSWQKPKTEGHGYYFTTPGGKRIYHPSSYGWPMVYHGSTLHVTVGAKWIARVRRNLENPPKGMRWTRDNGKICLIRKTDKMDFHPSYDSLSSKNFVTFVRKEMAKNYSLRLQTRRLEKIQNAQLSGCRVLLEDSRRAGNCVEGSLQFAEKRLNLSREQILAAPFLGGVSGARLLATGNENARRATLCAWERETTISI